MEHAKAIEGTLCTPPLSGVARKDPYYAGLGDVNSLN